MENFRETWLVNAVHHTYLTFSGGMCTSTGREFRWILFINSYRKYIEDNEVSVYTISSANVLVLFPIITARWNWQCVEQSLRSLCLRWKAKIVSTAFYAQISIVQTPNTYFVSLIYAGVESHNTLLFDHYRILLVFAISIPSFRNPHPIFTAELFL